MNAKVIKLGNYKGIKVPAINVEISEDSVDAQLNMIRVQSAVETDLGPDAAAEQGDITVIDYKGFVDGVAFQGGEDKEFSLTLGSGMFIPGFEEQLIGTKAGEEKDVVVTFPAQYHASNLAGKEAVFKCKVHKVMRKKMPEFNDAFVKENFQCETVEEFRTAVREELKEGKKAYEKQQWEDILINTVSQDSEIEIPKELLDTLAARLRKGAEMQMMQQGFSIEQYFEQTGQSDEAFNQMMRENAAQTLTQHAVMTGVAEAEGFTVSDAEYNAELKDLAAQYNMTPDAVKEALGEEGLKTFRSDILAKKGLQAMIDYAVEE